MVTVGTWLVVDAVLDNAATVAMQSGLDDDPVVARASSLRQRGWDANAAHDRSGQGPTGWPPNDDELAIGLSDDEHAFLLAQVADATAVTQSILAAHDLHPQVRAEQESSLTGLAAARAELAGD